MRRAIFIAALLKPPPLPSPLEGEGARVAKKRPVANALLSIAAGVVRALSIHFDRIDDIRQVVQLPESPERWDGADDKFYFVTIR